jgi:hypothetical protein
MIHDAAKVGGASVIHDAAKVAEIYPAAAERTQAQMLRQLERFPLDLNREDYRGSLGGANQIRLLRQQRRGRAMAKGYSKDCGTGGLAGAARGS